MALLLPAGVGLALAPAAAAQPAPEAPADELFAPVAAPDRDGLPVRAPTVRERFVVPDVDAVRGAVEAAADGGRLRLALFDDVVIDVPTKEFRPRPGGFWWMGSGTGPDGHEQAVSLALFEPTVAEAAAGQGARLRGHFWAGHPVRHYTLEVATGAVHAIGELDEARLLGDDEGDAVPPAGDEHVGEATTSGEAPKVTVPATTMSHGGLHFVDVMVVYTHSAEANGGTLADDVADWIEYANMANAASGIPMRFRLVHLARVEYTEAGSLQDDLNWLRSDAGVATMRQQSYADVVSMVVAYTGVDRCGRAGEPGSFSVVSTEPRCQGTMAHELGHNAGLHHDWAHDDNPGSTQYNWAHGFSNPTGQFRTVMAVGDVDLCPDCGRIPRWSDPNTPYGNFATGTPHDDPYPADNADALRRLYTYLENRMTPPNLPVGAYDTISQDLGGTRVTGWAVDFDTQTHPVTVHIYVDGTGHGAYVASKPRPDLANHYPNAGTAHGFDEVLFLADGVHDVCIFAIDTTNANLHTALGCKSIHARSNPLGSLEGASREPGGVWVGGWTVDFDAPTTPITVEVWAHGRLMGTQTASDRRDDVAAAHPGAGPFHGFSFQVTADQVGTYEFCVVARNVGAGQDRTLGCRTLHVAFDPYGNLEALDRAPTGARVTGWAIDPDTAVPIPVTFTVDGVPGGGGVADDTRTDVGNAYPAYGAAHGFSELLPLTPGRHEVCVVGANQPGTRGADAVIGCRTVDVDPGVVGSFEGASREGDTTVWVGGWAIDYDVNTPVTVHATVDGVPAGEIVADRPRSDVGNAYPEYGPNHGFSHNLVVVPGAHVVCLTARNVGLGTDDDLGCRNV